MSTTLIILIAIWLVIGLLIGALAENIWKRRPLGAAWDYLIAIVLSIGTGFLDWYLLPRFGIEGGLKFLVAVLEPAILALAGLWVVRLIKKA